ncbi:hypothetical protein OG462_43625 [Streptomyces sp. NBC_01077]|uniref:hypothetical protein n=1 Tax=Streptomyces sp. NBC_01077 TaxID=2903746 RepID=UPI00386DEA53|nr:hypothetical protein OG462_01380 [Streptomyces sp. NBC_01077]WSV43656.1 hypothetical protein OG462_43625 [Streptomyces sp. NBC_01077]
MTADVIGAAARTDPQLRIPLKPRVRRGLVITAEEDQIVIEGGPKKQLLRGRTATDLLPSLLAQLDGTRDHPSLARELGQSDDVIFKVLSLLWTCGVIEEGPPAESLAEVHDALADFLSRMGDSTGANPTWEQAAARLHGAQVEVFGDRTLAGLVQSELARALPVVVSDRELPQPGTTLAVCAGSPSAELVQHCWTHRLPLIRLRIDGRLADFGPYVQAGVTPCFSCLVTEDKSDERVATDGDHALAAALFARELFALVSRSTPTTLPLRWRRVDLETLRIADLSSATRSGCPNCSVVDGPLAEQASLAARFEAHVAIPPKQYADPKAHQMHYRPSNLALQHVSKAWPVARVVSLPEPPFEHLARKQPTAALGTEELSLLLKVTAGIQGEEAGKVLRWTATGGNLGSAGVFCIVRDVPGLDSGVYAYIPAEHRLASLSPSVEEDPHGAPLTLVLTGDYGKVASKYSAFALRIILLDSGCAQAAARVAARALRLEFSPRTRWDDDALAAAAGVDADHYPITAVIDLGVPR